MPSATNSSSSTLNGEFNSSFGHISFNGCVTPRKPGSKVSTPVSTFKYLKKPESMISNQNDDSICSFNGDQNSFFQAENDEELKGRRMEKALASIEEHLGRRDIDPFNSELCRAFLVKLNFPNREYTNDYKITNVNLPKLSKNQNVPINGVNYQIEKEVGRGSYGAVYRYDKSSLVRRKSF
jgi:checkpoint serine/threonine-protein kinase